MEFRPGKPEDAGRIRELSRDIWEGHDYLGEAIEGWIAEGGVYVGIIDGRIVGLSRIRRLADDDWWIEGLRVDPAQQGRGYGRLLHRATLAELRRIARGTVRFCTADTNRSVPLAERDGFREILRLPFLHRRYGQEGHPPLAEVLARYDVREAGVSESGLVDLLLEGCRESYAGLLPLGWHHRMATRETLLRELAGARILVPGKPGSITAALVVTRSGEGPDLSIVLGPPETVERRILPCLRALAVESGWTNVGGAVPTEYSDGLLAAGFRVPDGFKNQLVFEMKIK